VAKSANPSTVSYFLRPFGPGHQPEPTLAERLSRDWEELEGRLSKVPTQDRHPLVGDFLRRWSLLMAQAPAAEQGPLAHQLESARASLLSQIATAREEANSSVSLQSQAVEQAERHRKSAAMQAEVRRIQEESARLEEATRAATAASMERNFQLTRAALFPEQHCPYCARAYLDLNGGCWHCQSHHRPGHF
jgi:hypothetical protein